MLGGERFYRMDFPNFCDHIRGFAGFDNSYMLDPVFLKQISMFLEFSISENSGNFLICPKTWSQNWLIFLV